MNVRKHCLGIWMLLYECEWWNFDKQQGGAENRTIETSLLKLNPWMAKRVNIQMIQEVSSLGRVRTRQSPSLVTL